MLCCSIRVTKGQVLYLQVTGSDVNDYGAFTLNVIFALPGASAAVAQDLGNDAMVAASGDTTGFPSTYNSSCNGGADGPDMVRVWGLKLSHLLQGAYICIELIAS